MHILLYRRPVLYPWLVVLRRLTGATHVGFMGCDLQCIALKPLIYATSGADNFRLLHRFSWLRQPPTWPLSRQAASVTCLYYGIGDLFIGGDQLIFEVMLGQVHSI